jgi:hypothetical protein
MSRRNEVKQMSVKHGHPAILFINHSWYHIIQGYTWYILTLIIYYYQMSNLLDSLSNRNNEKIYPNWIKYEKYTLNISIKHEIFSQQSFKPRMYLGIVIHCKIDDNTHPTRCIFFRMERRFILVCEKTVRCCWEVQVKSAGSRYSADYWNHPSDEGIMAS